MRPYHKNRNFTMDKWKEKKEKLIDNSFNIENLTNFPYLNNNNNKLSNIEENKKSWLDICNENKDKEMIEKKKINTIKNKIIEEEQIEEENIIKPKIDKIKNILNDDGSITIVKKTKINSKNDNNICIKESSFVYKDISKKNLPIFKPI